MRLPCVFCNDGAGKAGKLLKCLHKICLDCLAHSIQQDGTIRCSKCRRSTPCPPPGFNHRQVLVDDSMFDPVPDSHDGTKKANEKDNVLEIVADESMSPSSIPQESTSSQEVRSTAVYAQRFHKQNPHHGRVHLCPYHINMKLVYYCTRCQEVLCERCKVQIKHASHIDQINNGTEVAAALRHRLTERLRNLVPDDNEKEVDESLDYAGDLVTAFECDSARAVSSIKTMIHEQCEELLLRGRKRKEELISEGEIRKKELVEILDHSRESHNETGALEHILKAPRYALRNEDIVKMHPHSIQLLTNASRDVMARGRSLLRRLAFKDMSEADSHFRIMGKVVDNTDIDLSSCCFPSLAIVGYAGEKAYLTVPVRNRRGQPLSGTALKVSSIQIWATRIEGGFSPAAPDLVPIVGYSKGEVHALFQINCSEQTVFLLELLLDTPSVLPDFQKGSLGRNLDMYFPLKSWLFLYKSRASNFNSDFCSPREYIEVEVVLSHLSQPFPGKEIRQVKDGVATARAIEPVQDRDFGVSILIGKCKSRKLDIGFTWDSADTSQDMKLVLASSANSNSSSSPIRDLAPPDILHITRCPDAQDEYNIDHYDPRSGLLKNKHYVTLGSNTKPILMVRMFHCGTCIQVFHHDKEQRNQFVQDVKSRINTLAQRGEK